MRKELLKEIEGIKVHPIEGHGTQYNYCPNCGARMDGDDNEID